MDCDLDAVAVGFGFAGRGLVVGGGVDALVVDGCGGGLDVGDALVLGCGGGGLVVGVGDG